jgi:hypothetical protein
MMQSLGKMLFSKLATPDGFIAHSKVREKRVGCQPGNIRELLVDVAATPGRGLLTAQP